MFNGGSGPGSRALYAVVLIGASRLSRSSLNEKNHRSFMLHLRGSTGFEESEPDTLCLHKPLSGGDGMTFDQLRV